MDSPGTSKSPLLTAIRSALAGPQPDFAIPALIAEQMDIQGLVSTNAAVVMLRLSEVVPTFAGLTYQKLGQVEEQWPIVGRGDLYYGGTTYSNSQGLGIHLPLLQQNGQLTWPQVDEFKLPKLGMMAFPVTRLYDRGNTLLPSELLHQRIGEPFVVLSAQDAERMKVRPGAMLRITFSATGISTVVAARLDENLPERVVLAPRSFGLPVSGPTLVEIKPA